VTEKNVVFGLFPDRLKLSNEPVAGKDRLEEIQKEWHHDLSNLADSPPSAISPARFVKA
jgi:hypothetical protein